MTILHHCSTLLVACLCTTTLATVTHATKVKDSDELIQNLFDLVSDLQTVSDLGVVSRRRVTLAHIPGTFVLRVANHIIPVLNAHAPVGTVTSQVKEDVPLVPLMQFYKQKGIYPSSVKFNLHGDHEMAEARRLLEVFDNNMFTTTWISLSLLEAYRYGQAPRPTETQLSLAIDSLQKHVDRNKPYNTSVMFFWPLTYNETVQFWQATPENLLVSLNIPMNVIVEILDLLGLNNLTSYVEEFFAPKDFYLHILHLCADMDDTFVNLGLGSLLFEMRNEFPESSSRWRGYHSNLTSIFDALKKYAYRPFQNDSDTDLIDPRTYMYLRYFLDDAKAAGKDVALVTTWAQSLTELRTEIKKGVTMPFNVNNVDSTVCANTINGITAAVLSGLVGPEVLEDPLIAQIYHNSSALVVFEIETNLSSRPDLALPYYPSQMVFNWFVSRTVAMLDIAAAKGALPVQVMEDVHAMLQRAVKGNMTSYILSEAKQDEQGDIFYDDFLGDGDLTPDNQPLERGEDRIFTTAMAVNALLYTWTNFNETTRRSSWKTDVPPSVKTVVSGCVNWLTKHTLDLSYKPWNVFFAGSVKGLMTVTGDYPANLLRDTNGTVIPWSEGYNFLKDTIAVKGYIQPEEYASLLKQKKSPLDFTGYNYENYFFSFWSSDSFTYSVTMLALSRYSMTDD